MARNPMRQLTICDPQAELMCLYLIASGKMKADEISGAHWFFNETYAKLFVKLRDGLALTPGGKYSDNLVAVHNEREHSARDARQRIFHLVAIHHPERSFPSDANPVAILERCSYLRFLADFLDELREGVLSDKRPAIKVAQEARRQFEAEGVSGGTGTSHGVAEPVSRVSDSPWTAV